MSPSPNFATHVAATVVAAAALAGLPALAPAQTGSAQAETPQADTAPPEPSFFASHWQHFSQRHDSDSDGVVSREEFQAAENRHADHRFDRLDSDGDGQLTETDFESFRGRGPHHRFHGRFPGGMGHVLFGMDADRSGDVSFQEWQDFLVALDPDGDGTVSREELETYTASRAEELRLPRNRERAGSALDPYEMLTRRVDQDDDGVLETSDLEAAYNQLDTDGDGALASSELPHFRHRAGHRAGFRGGPRHGGMMLRKADSDQNEELSREEWEAFLAELDADSDGEISAAELATAFEREPRHPRPSVPVLQLSEAFDAADQNGDGVIEGEEWPSSFFGRRAGPRGRGPTF
ncbi:MAG: EF-hand domain-containing protein [Holophagales bacterium]|nr:EF-hand domain-containing protein [Holophagales bacterium]